MLVGGFIGWRRNRTGLVVEIVWCFRPLSERAVEWKRARFIISLMCWSCLFLVGRFRQCRVMVANGRLVVCWLPSCVMVFGGRLRRIWG